MSRGPGKDEGRDGLGDLLVGAHLPDTFWQILQLQFGVMGSLLSRPWGFLVCSFIIFAFCSATGMGKVKKHLLLFCMFICEMSEEWVWIKGKCQARRGGKGNITGQILVGPLHEHC